MEPSEARSIGRAPLSRSNAEPFELALDGLTPSQARAVASDARALCVVAGAGSGKTSVLTLRMARRIRDGSASADHTVSCTFTRKAARELQERLRRYGVAVSSPGAAGATTEPGVRAGTIHRLALGLLRRHALDSGRPPPTVDGDRVARLHRIAGDRAVAAAVDVEIGWAKAQCLPPERYADAASRTGRDTGVPLDRVVEVFSAYQASLERAHLVDLDDILVQATERLVGDEAFAARAHWRYRHLFVDEFQDINPAQYALVDTLGGVEKDLCAVGDPNQAIYGWNGADPTLLDRLTELVPGLEPSRSARTTARRHRSWLLRPRHSVTPVSNLPDRRHPTARHPSSLPSTTRSPRPKGSPRSCSTGRDDGVPWSEQAVVARTHDQLLDIAAALGRAGIPVRMASGPGGAVAGGDPRDEERSGVGAVGSVELATFHRAKGLEWTRSASPDSRTATYRSSTPPTTASRAEERRLLYVALTRACRDLHCSWARTRTTGAGRVVERQPSPWLAAIEPVATRGSGRIDRAEGTRRVAALRAGLGGRRRSVDVHVDEDGRVVGRLLALARVAVDQPVAGARGQRLCQKDQIDPETLVLVERCRPGSPTR